MSICIRYFGVYSSGCAFAMESLFCHLYGDRFNQRHFATPKALGGGVTVFAEKLERVQPDVKCSDRLADVLGLRRYSQKNLVGQVAGLDGSSGLLSAESLRGRPDAVLEDRVDVDAAVAAQVDGI